MRPRGHGSLMAIGIPLNPVMATMTAAFIVAGTLPGSSMIRSNTDLFGGLVANMWRGKYSWWC